MDKLATIITSLIAIIFIIWMIRERIRENMLQDDPKLRELWAILETMFMKDKYYTGNLESLNNRDIMNEIRLYKGNKSYTINKEKIFLCLKDNEGNYYPNNTLLYVLIHEISHVLNTKNVGHTQEFHDIFEDLLDLATEEGIYSPSIPVPHDYCIKPGEKYPEE